MISEKQKAVIQLISEFQALVRESQSSQKKLFELHQLVSSLSEEKETLLEERKSFKEMESRLNEKTQELESEKRNNQKLLFELKSLQQKKDLPSASSEDKRSSLENSLAESRKTLLEKEEELIHVRDHLTADCKRRELERDDLMRTLAETANQLQRQLSLIRELKEEILRLQGELSRSSSEKEAHVEEIARLKTKLHEFTLFLEKKENAYSDDGETTATLRSHLENALSLLPQKGEEP